LSNNDAMVMKAIQRDNRCIMTGKNTQV